MSLVIKVSGKYMIMMKMNSTDGCSISFLKINKNIYNQKFILIFETLERYEENMNRIERTE